MATALLKRPVAYLRRSETSGPVLLAVAVGLAGGIGAIVFRFMVARAHEVFFGTGEAVLGFLGPGYVILLPAIGLPLVAYMVRRWAPEARGHSVPEVMYAIRKGGGRIRPRVAAIQALASAICIGSGGSVGREGPIVQIGGTVGSALGQALKLREERITVLLACGAAAGLAGTFNAPIAGVIFALEVLLGGFASRSFGLVVISSVTSTALTRSVLGMEPAFPLREVFRLVSSWELPLYLLLGVGTGFVSLLYIRTIYGAEDLFDRWPWPEWIKDAIGGLGVGIVGYAGILWLGEPHLFGVGYEAVERVLQVGHVTLLPPEAVYAAAGALLLLGALKILNTALTLAAGGSGGIFAPALFVGAMVGAAFGVFVNHLMPLETAPPGAYALVGMAAVFGGAAHAPISAILILFEMTGDYQIILPLMLSVVVSHLISLRIGKDSIYTIKLRRIGGLAPPTPEPSVLDLILVSDAMETEIRTARVDEPVSELAAKLGGSRTRALPVTDANGHLEGIVRAEDVAQALLGGRAQEQTAGDIMRRSPRTCTPDQHLSEVLRIPDLQDSGQIPVVDPDDPDRLIGLLRDEEILWAYGEMAAEHHQLRATVPLAAPLGGTDLVQQSFEVRAEHKPICYRRVREIEFPTQCLIALLQRGERVVIPRGDTVIEPGDVLLAFTTRDREADLQSWFRRLTSP